MFGSIILDMAIGLALVYLFLSLICTTVNEAIAGFFNLRARTLEKALVSMIDNPDLVEKIYNSPVIFGLWQSRTRLKTAEPSGPAATTSEIAAGFEKGVGPSAGYAQMLRLPSYLPPKQFAHAVLDVIKTYKDAAGKEIDQLEQAIAAMPPGPFRDALLSMAARVDGDAEKFRLAVEKWFDYCMDRVSGWYKRRIQLIGFVVALGVAGVCNADTLEIAGRLYHDAALRSAVTATAVDYVKNQTELGIGNLPIGWTDTRSFPDKPWDQFSKVVGLLITAGALTVGAPFWFDMLNGLVNIRLAGLKPGENKASRKKGGERAIRKWEPENDEKVGMT